MNLELQCIDFLKEIYFPNGIYCKKCKKITKHYQSKTRPRNFQCVCGWQIGITSGTIFHKALRLDLWFQALFLLEKHGKLYSAWKIQKATNTTYKTAWRMKKLLLPLLDDPKWQSFLVQFHDGKRENDWESYKQRYLKVHQINGKMGAEKQWKIYYRLMKNGEWEKRTFWRWGETKKKKYFNGEDSNKSPKIDNPK